MNSDDLVEIEGEKFAETSLAWGGRFVPMGGSDTIEVWIPKSQGDYLGGGRWLIPQWLAHKHDLI